MNPNENVNKNSPLIAMSGSLNAFSHFLDQIVEMFSGTECISLHVFLSDKQATDA